MKRFVCILILLTCSHVHAQDLAQQANNIFEHSCLGCHGPNGTFTEELIITYPALMNSGTIVPGDPERSEFYQRLLGNTTQGPQMPLGQPPLPPAAIDTIRQWILAGAPDWAAQHDINFITPEAMLNTIKTHLESLSVFDRFFARYFTMTHLYNAGETPETLHAYQTALSKLLNSLSWGAAIHNPEPIDDHATLFHIDIRNYDWDIDSNAWAHIEDIYPYLYSFGSPVYETLRQEMDCEVPFVHVDWFLANAARPPLYHDILNLPNTDQELESRLGLDVQRNLINAPGRRVWRAGFNDSGVSNHNRVVERHLSRYGAYWKSYDFAGSAGRQNIFTHPLDFRYDGGEIVFSLPNGLQAYYLADANGKRLDAAPIQIVSNPAADDPTVRNGISCIGCHTEGMKTFEDKMRIAIEQNANPLFDKVHALRLYVEQAQMDTLVQADTDRYEAALTQTGSTFGGIEPIHRFHDTFWGPVSASYAAAALGLETETFLEQVRTQSQLHNLGLSSLIDANGTIKRDTWTQHFGEIVYALQGDTGTVFIPSETSQIRPTLEDYAEIPDPNLRAAIKKSIGKELLSILTLEDMQRLTSLNAHNMDIEDLTGLEVAINLQEIEMGINPLLKDISPLSGLIRLQRVIVDGTSISDISPLSELVNLTDFRVNESLVSDITPLSNLRKLTYINLSNTHVRDITPLSGLTKLTELYLDNNAITDISPLAELTRLRTLGLSGNNISDVSPLAGLISLEWLNIQGNVIIDFSPLTSLPKNPTILQENNPGYGSGKKIVGPWLWLFIPDTRLDGHTDLLAEASGGKTTEVIVSTKGATEGKAVGESIWIRDKISPIGFNNIGEIANRHNLGEGNNDNAVFYGSITINVSAEQQTTMYVGSDDSVIVWLNGQKIHQEIIARAADDYQTDFPVFLKAGRNVLLVAVDNWSGWWSGFFGFEPGLAYTVNPSDTPSVQEMRASDVNEDGIVNIQDLVIVAQFLGESEPANPRADVNGDGVVNILDLVSVANDFGVR